MKAATFCLVIIIITFFNNTIIHSASKTSTGNGNWSTSSLWNPPGVPESGDDVFIEIGNNVLVDGNYICKTLTLNGNDNSNGSVSIGGSNILTVSGTININSPKGNSSNSISVGTGTLNVGGSISLLGSKTTEVIISTGVVNINGGISFGSTSSQITFSGSGVLNVGGNIGSGGTFTASTGTVNLNGSAAQIISGAYIFNNLVLSGSGVKTISGVTVNGTLSMKGTATASAAPTYGSSSILEYAGSSAQVTGPELTATLPNLIINNSNGVTLNRSITINNSLVFNNGVLNSGSNTVTLGASSTISETNGKYLVGNLLTGPRTVNSNGSSFSGIGVTLAAGVDVGDVSITRVSGSAGIVNANGNQSIARKWTITTTTVPLSPIGLTLQWVTDDINSVDLSNAGVYKSADGNEPWSQVGLSQDVSAANSISVPVSSFSVFTVGATDSPLPVELSSFTASNTNNIVVLSWTTKTELYNYGFAIERKSDRSDWIKIGFVQGYVNSNSPHQYTFNDKVTNGLFFYRLKQINSDATYKYCNPISIEVKTVPAKYDIINYPNPFNPSTTIQFDLPQSSYVNLSVYNIIGEKVATLVNGIMEAGTYKKTFSENFLNENIASGIYFYNLSTDNGVSITKKMILTK